MRKGLLALLSLQVALSLFVVSPAHAKRFYGCDGWSGFWIGHHRNHSDWDIGRVRPYRDFSVGGCNVSLRSTNRSIGYNPGLYGGLPLAAAWYGSPGNLLSASSADYNYVDPYFF